MNPKQDDVWLVALDPTLGVEIQKTRPCLIVSPDEMNERLQTVIVAPMTTTIRSYPTRVSVRFQGKPGHIALDQIRAVDKLRLLRRVGSISAQIGKRTSETLIEMFGR